MPKISKTILLGAGGVAVLAAAALLLANVYLQSEEVRSRVRKAASSALGAPVEIGGTHYTPWGGLVVRGLAVPDGDVAGRRVLEAPELRIRPALLPLLAGRAVLRSVELSRPVLIARQREDRTWAGLVPPPPDRRIAVPVKPAPAGGARGGVSFQVEVERIVVRDAKFVFVDKDGRTLLRAEKVVGEAEVYPGGGSSGSFQIGRLVLADQLRLKRIGGPFSWDGRVLEMPAIEGVFGGGRVTGAYRLETGEAPGFQFRGEVREASLPKILEDSGREPGGAAGTLRGGWELSGDPRRVDSWHGGGDFEIEGARLVPVDFLVQAGRMFSIEELQELNLSEARLDFSVRESRVWIESLRMRSENLVLQGAGSVDFEGGLSLDSSLLVNRRIQKQLRPVMGPNFVDAGEEGYKRLDFRVFNTLANPHTDFLDKLVGGRVGREVGQFLRQILGPPAPRKPAAAEE